MQESNDHVFNRNETSKISGFTASKFSERHEMIGESPMLSKSPVPSKSPSNTQTVGPLPDPNM